MSDEQGTVYTLTALLGQGGQGTVWRTQFPDRIVKLLARGAAPEALRRRLAYVRGLRLDGLPIARPLELLQAPDLGYVATLLRDMVPLEHLCTMRAGADIADDYRSTGGLRRRLRLLAHLGEILGEVHGKGLSYVDLSPGNLFVSGSAEHHEAWLIDADNLRHDASPESAVYTPGYGAPEVISGQSGPTTLSDAWGLAVLVVQTLSLVHPFCGDHVELGPSERLEDAHAARVPWIGHQDDASNRASHGIPLERVMGRGLRDLARQTFEDTSPLQRPGVAAWVDALHATADQTVVCGGCTSTFLANAPECPWCGEARPRVRELRVERWEPARGLVVGKPPVARLALGSEPVSLSRRVTRAHVGPRARQTDGVLTPVERGLHVQMTGLPAWLTRQGSHPLPEPLPLENHPRTVPLRDPGGDWLLHLGPLDQHHRVIRLGGT